MFLAAGELAASCADIRFNTIRILRDELPGVGLFKRFYDLCVCGFRPTHEYVFLDCSVEQDGLLLNITNLFSQFTEFQVC